jgi:PAS domain S-box-containing protein
MRSENRNLNINRLSTSGVMITAAVIYFVTARLSLLLAVGNTNATSVWPPSGIALAVILLWGYRMGPAILLGAFFANVFALKGYGLAPAYYLTASFTTAAGNMLEGLIGAWCIRRFAQTENPFNTLKELFVFIIFGSLLATMVSASIGVGSYCLATGQWPVASQMWITWWLGDAAGILIVFPIIMMLKKKMVQTIRGIQSIEAIIVFLILLVFSGVIFGYNYQIEYMIIPPLLWIAMRFGRFYSAAAVFLVSGIAVLFTISGLSPLADPTAHKSLLYLQTYIGVISVITLCLSVLTHNRKIAERDLKNYKEHLEEKIKERSAELVRANEKLVTYIQNQDRVKMALSESEKKYRDLVESANSVILRWKPDGSITFFNAYAQKFFGFTEPEILGRNILGSIVPVLESSGRDLSWLIDDIISKPEVHAFNENENIRKNGEKVWIAWTNKPIFDESGSITEILSVGNDITKRKKIEESLKRTLDDLAIAKERAESADRIKSAFLAAMSHELRTPLNSIIGFTGIVLQGLTGPLNKEQEKQLGMVRGSARHLLDLINDILDISKIEAGQLQIISETFDLRKSIEKAVQIILPLSDKKNLSLHFKIEDNVSEMCGDQRRVEQILINLLSNAVKFTDEGEINLHCHFDNHSIILSVVDTGIGIKPENLNIIFDAFRQVDTGIARAQEGTGLGLNITKKLLEMMGGSIHVESEFGKGSNFTIRLPKIKEQ